MMAELKPCPFCGGNEIELSIKTTKNDLVWYVSMFCKSCHCYGKRTRVTVSGDGWVSRRTIETSAEAREIAIEAWNRRSAEDAKVETNIYDKEEIFPDCTVQVLTNTVTGETSVGWWKNEN